MAGANRAEAKSDTRTLLVLVILNAVKNLVLYRGVASFLWETPAQRKVALGCCRTRFFAPLRMTRSSLALISDSVCALEVQKWRLDRRG